MGTLYGHPLDYKPNITILGILFNVGLHWNEHVLQKIKLCKKKLMTIHRKQGKMWGLQPKMALYVYTGIVRPSFTHGSMVWISATDRADVKEKMRSFQLTAMRTLGFRRKSTP